LTGIIENGQESIEKTNRALGIVKSFLPKTMPEEAVHVAMGKALEEAQREFMEEGFKGSEEPTKAEPTKEQRIA
jgi:glyceraldehyde-3-phosphate dehydrogenase (NAD(P))